jgi:hypothetical protein
MKKPSTDTRDTMRKLAQDVHDRGDNVSAEAYILAALRTSMERLRDAGDKIRETIDPKGKKDRS